MTSRIYKGAPPAGVCFGSAGVACEEVWILERDPPGMFKAKAWLFGSHQGCGRSKTSASTHLETCSPFTCDQGNTVEAEGYTEEATLRAFADECKKLSNTLFD